MQTLIQRLSELKEQENSKAQSISAISAKIAELFSTKTALLTTSGGVITKEVDGICADIEREFKVKSTHEHEVRQIREQILDLVLN